MKSQIHPPYYPEAKVRCACGATYTIGSTQPTLEVEICASCHPFFTGQEKVIDIAGKVERFKQRRAQKAEIAATRGGKKQKTQKRKTQLTEKLRRKIARESKEG